MAVFCFSFIINCCKRFDERRNKLKKNWESSDTPTPTNIYKYLIYALVCYYQNIIHLMISRHFIFKAVLKLSANIVQSLVCELSWCKFPFTTDHYYLPLSCKLKSGHLIKNKQKTTHQKHRGKIYS